MSKKPIMPLILVLVLGFPAALAAQDVATAVSGAAAGQGSVTAEAAEARIDSALETALSAGVPVALLESKIAEGRAKGVAVERIAAAVEGRLAALTHAMEAMTEAGVDVRSEGELSVAVDALEAGVGENALVRVSGAASPERRIVAIAVLTDLVRLGNASENALARVSAALGTNTALANLSAEVASNAALSNLQAEVAAQLRAQGLGATLDAPGRAGVGAGGSGVGAGANANGAVGIGIGNGAGANAGAGAGAEAGGTATIPAPPSPPAPPPLPDLPQLPNGGLEATGGLDATGGLGL